MVAFYSNTMEYQQYNLFGGTDTMNTETPKDKINK